MSNPPNLDLDAFSLTKDGPFLRLCERLRLVSAEKDWPQRRIAALILITWVPLFVLSAVQDFAIGGTVTIPFIYDFPVSLRFLVVIPLLIVSEQTLEGIARPVLLQLVNSGLVRDSDYPRLASTIDWVGVARRSPVAELVIVGIVIFGVGYLKLEFTGPGSTWEFGHAADDTARTWAGWWYLIVSLPIFQFVMLRWLWRYLLWCWFLWRVSQLDLRLMPSHPDRVGGLGFLGILHQKLVVFVFALEVLPAAHFGQEVLFAGKAISDYQILIPVYVAIGLVLILAPLFVFTSGLVAVKRAGLLAYSALATEYTREFDRKWLGRERPPSEPLLGSADIQSLADLGNSFALVRNMSVVPFDVRTTLLTILGAAAIPYTPLALIVIPLNEVFDTLVQIFL